MNKRVHPLACLSKNIPSNSAATGHVSDAACSLPVRKPTVTKFRWALALGGAVAATQTFAQVPAPAAGQPGAARAAAQVPAGRPAQAAPTPAAPAVPEQKALELDADRTPSIITKGSCLIKNGTLLTVTQGILPNTDVLIQNGKISQIGKGLTAPTGVTVIDATGKFVTPGLIDAHSHIALDAVNEGSDSITAEVRMHDVINPQSISLYRGLSNGVTSSLLLHGSANPIGGQSVVVKMKYKRPVEDMIVPDAPRMIKFALGENVKQSNGGGGGGGAQRFPGTRMGVEAVYRRAFMEAQKYSAAWDKYNADKAINPNAVPPRRDLRLETLADILKRKIWVQCHSYRADEMLMMVRLSQEFKFKLAAMQHGLEAYKIAPEIVGAGVGVSTFADAWAYKVEAFDAIPYNAALCYRAGIVTSVNSDNSEGTYRLNIEAANSMKYGGLNENEALRMVTINPAIQMGIDKRAGSLETGKDGDITIWDGHPLSVYSKARMTLVEGEVFYQRRDPFGIDALAMSKNTVDTHPSVESTPPVPPMRRAYAIVGAMVHPVSSADIPNGTVIIEDGKIKAVGAHVSVPSGAYVVHAKGMHVYPGLIDAGSEVGLQEVESLRATIDSAEAGEFQPDLLAVTAVNPGSEHLAIARGAGITAVAVRPSGGTISGQMGVIDLAGWTPELMRVKSPTGLQVNFPESGTGRARQSAFLTPEILQQIRDRDTARARLLRDYFDKAKRYATARAQNPSGTLMENQWEAMIPYVTGKAPVIITVTSAAAARRAIQFGDDLGLKIVLSGGADVWKAADLLAKKNIPFIYNIPINNSITGIAPADDYDPTDTAWSAPAVLQRAGVKLCFETLSAPEAKNLPRQVGIMCAYGLPHEAAIRALTLNAAQVLGVGDQMGSLDAGKMANIIVTDGDPLEVTTNVQNLFIGGKPILLESKHTRLYTLYKQRLPETASSPSTIARKTTKTSVH